jgi:hypothetical protein
MSDKLKDLLACIAELSEQLYLVFPLVGGGCRVVVLHLEDDQLSQKVHGRGEVSPLQQNWNV